MFLFNPFRSFKYSFIFLLCAGVCQQESYAQVPIKAKCTAVSYDVRLRDVNFTLLQNNHLDRSEYASKGRMKFRIPSAENQYRLILEKPGFITKEVIFDVEEYPFKRKFNSLNLDLTMYPLQDEGPTQLVYTLGFSNMEQDYKITKVDSVYTRVKERLKNKKKQEQDEEQRLQAIYDTAMVNADALWKLEEFKYAKGYYQIANKARPGSEYIQNRLLSIDSAIAAVKEREKQMLAEKAKDPSASTPSDQATETEEKKYFSVQIGAFYDWMDESAFETVPEFLVIQGEVYKRCFTGQFNTRAQAKIRKKEMINAGFSDAFIVEMKGIKRIGY